MTTPQYIISHDVGTSSNKAALVDLDGNIKAYDTENYPIFYPQVNWAEQEPCYYWEAIAKTTRHVVEKTGVSPSDIIGMVFSTQVLGIIPIDRNDEVLHRAIIWMDGRATKQAEKIMRKFGGRQVFAALVGTCITGKDGMAKLLWLKENEPEIYNKMECFLDVNGYLIFRATAQKVFEWSCASAFGFDLKKKDWMRMVLNYIGLDLNKFPRLVRSIDKVGGLTFEAAEACGLLPGTPVFGGCGDMQSAAIGSGAIGEGDGHIYLGTSGWVGVTTSKAPTGSHGVVTLQSGDPNMNLLIGEMETAGACLEWVKNEFYKHEQNDPNILNIYALMDDEIRSVSPGADYLICTPWLYGERCPVTDPIVRSTFFNLSASHRREHMLRAVYEGVAYNLRWIVEILEHKFAFSMPVLRVIGGGSKGVEWMQIIADITNRQVETLLQPQMAGTLGAALIATVGLGIYPDFKCANQLVTVDRIFHPQPQNIQVYNELYNTYKSLYYSLRKVYRNINCARVQRLHHQSTDSTDKKSTIPL